MKAMIAKILHGTRIYRILHVGECLFISSLPGKASRALLKSQGLSSDSTCVFEAKPGNLYIKRREPGVLYVLVSCRILAAATAFE